MKETMVSTRELLAPPLPYDAFQSSLLLGEADFSFADAFSKIFSGTITATEVLPGDKLLAIYPQLAVTLPDMLKRTNVQHILSGVDAKRLGDADCSCLPFNAETMSFSAPATCTTNFWNLLAHVNTPPIDLVIFNFPHTEKFGKAPKLLKRMFAALEQIILLDDNINKNQPQGRRRISQHCVVELRLRDLERCTRKARVDYQQEVAAAASHFSLVGVYNNDLVTAWEPRGYQHCISGQNRSCGRGMPCEVWRWRYHPGKE